MRRLAHTHLWLMLFVLAGLHVVVWGSVRDVKARWLNVPPVPTQGAARAMALGDMELSYRTTAVMLSNLGSTGGRAEPFKDYDYNRLKQWLFLTLALDSRSDLVPFLGAYYFGAVEDPEKIRPLIDYLEAAGKGTQEGKWRWLAQAVYLARFKLKDMDLASRLATELAASKDPTLPPWAVQMPAFVMTQRGDKQAAFEIMTSIMKSQAGKMPVQEMNFMRHYICTKILDPEEAKTMPLCQDIQW